MYKTANAHYKEKFGCKVYKLSLDGGFTCPNRDGRVSTGGCIFCSAFGSGEFAERGEDILTQLESAKKRVVKMMLKRKKRYADRTDTDGVATFMFSCTGEIPKRSYFDESVELEFEGRKFSAPKAYHEFLTDSFGDYMQLPPEDKQA